MASAVLSTRQGNAGTGVTPHIAQAMPLSQKPLLRAYEDVEIIFQPALSNGVCRTGTFSRVRWATRASQMLLTTESILFLDGKDPAQPWKVVLPRRFDSDGLLPQAQLPETAVSDAVCISKFWTLRQSVNEQLDLEFQQNPAAYALKHSKAGLVWRVERYREWCFVASFRYVKKDNFVDFGLSLVRVMSKPGRGKQAPQCTFCGTARVLLRDEAKAWDLAELLATVVKPDEFAFSHQYLEGLQGEREAE
jgi:hypothetical protein